MTVPLAADAPERVLPYGARGYADGLLATWWSVPRAVEVNGRTFAGGVSQTDYSVPFNNWEPALNGGGNVSVVELGVERKHRIIEGRDAGLGLVHIWADDHNTPAMLIEADRPPLIATGHRNGGDYLVVRVGTGDPLDLTELGAVQQIQFPDAVSYAQPIRVADDEVIILTRVLNDWHFARSTDWGATWTTHPLITSGSGQPVYILSARSGNTLRFGTIGNPDSTIRDIRAFEIDLTTGAISDDNGTIANLDGTDLPITNPALPIRFAAPAGDRTRLLDVSPDGSMAFATWPNTDPDAATYRVVDPAGTVTDVTDAGTRIGYHSANYLGGMVFASPTEVWLARNDNAGEWVDMGTPVSLGTYHENFGSTWTIERHTQAGGTWSLAETLATSTDKLVRPVVPLNRTAGPRVLWHQISGGYADYNVWSDDRLDWDGNPDSTTQENTPL